MWTLKDFQMWGAEGGRKGKHTLTAERARAMVRARERKRKLRQKVDGSGKP